MKQLILVRHAKSDLSYDVPDFNRPLSEQGHQDARKMAKFLIGKEINIQGFVSSPAKRAITTARYFAETYSNPNIKKTEQLYEPHLEDFENTILSLENEYDSVALFSHNPNISEFASSIVQSQLHFPTCGVAVIEIACDNWLFFENAPKKLLHFFSPKEIE